MHHSVYSASCIKYHEYKLYNICLYNYIIIWMYQIFEKGTRSIKHLCIGGISCPFCKQACLLLQQQVFLILIPLECLSQAYPFNTRVYRYVHFWCINYTIIIIYISLYKVHEGLYVEATKVASSYYTINLYTFFMFFTYLHRVASLMRDNVQNHHKFRWAWI